MKVEYYRIPEVEEERPTTAQAYFLFIHFFLEKHPYETIFLIQEKWEISKHCCEKLDTKK